jgi:Mn-dependent DtxR family transcriptional regulator
MFAEILDVAPKTISNYRKRAEREGYLVLVKEHEGRRKATEYRFNLDVLDLQGQSDPEGTGD